MLIDESRLTSISSRRQHSRHEHESGIGQRRCRVDAAQRGRRRSRPTDHRGLCRRRSGARGDLRGGRLPAAELAAPGAGRACALRRALAARRELPRVAIEVLRAAAAERTSPMDALRMAAPLLSLGRREDPLEDAMTAIAAFPTIVGTYWRLLHGEAPVAVRGDLGHAAHYLHQLSGAEPSADRARALETYLNTVCDHGLNASTFTARVIVSTRSDVISAITGAVGALKGPLHGGAPGPALDMVFEIGTPERAEPVHPRAARPRRAAHGLRSPCVSRSRPARRRARGGGRAAACERTRIGRCTSSRVTSRRRRFGSCASGSPIGDSTRTSSSTRRCCCMVSGLPTELFTPTFAVGPSARLVGALSRAASRRPADSSAVGLHWSAGPSFRGTGGDRGCLTICFY